MGVRRQAREAAIQALFMCDFLGSWDTESVSFCFDHFTVSKAARAYAQRVAEGVVKQMVRIDSQITCASEHWSISRMGRVDRAILRLATYEISYLSDIPTNVAINEAIEIAKRFGSEDSPVFINGVLDKIASTLRSRIEVVDVAEEPVAQPRGFGRQNLERQELERQQQGVARQNGFGKKNELDVSEVESDSGIPVATESSRDI